MPLFDAFSDFLVMFNWAAGDESHHFFFVISLGIHFVSGTISGALFSFWNKEHLPLALEHGGKFLDGTTVGVVLGWLGAIPCLQAWLTVMDARSLQTSDSYARSDLEHLKFIKAIDLLLETLPQLALQMHVGVSFGELDPSSGSFDWILSWSICMGLIVPGLTLTSIENLGRNMQRREGNDHNQSAACCEICP